MKYAYLLSILLSIFLFSCSKDSCSSYTQNSAGAINQGGGVACQWSSFVFYCLDSPKTDSIFPMVVSIDNNQIGTIVESAASAPQNCSLALPDSIFCVGTLPDNKPHSWTAVSIKKPKKTATGTIYSSAEKPCQPIRVY